MQPVPAARACLASVAAAQPAVVPPRAVPKMSQLRVPPTYRPAVQERHAGEVAAQNAKHARKTYFNAMSIFYYF